MFFFIQQKLYTFYYVKKRRLQILYNFYKKKGENFLNTIYYFNLFCTECASYFFWMVETFEDSSTLFLEGVPFANHQLIIYEKRGVTLRLLLSTQTPQRLPLGHLLIMHSLLCTSLVDFCFAQPLSFMSILFGVTMRDIIQQHIFLGKLS